MDKNANDIYSMTEEREKKVWENCIFVFDTSALLSFYLCPEDTRNQIFKEILENLKGRLWVPYHVQFEFLKNRTKKIYEPINNSYLPLKEKHIKPILEYFAKATNLLEDFKNKVKKSDNHPHMEVDIVDSFKTKIEAFQKTAEEFGLKINDQIDKKILEISKLESNDTVFEALSKYFEVGKDYPFKHILEISLEGKKRYELSIPPGYQDLKDKIGTQIFGDLIVWKQILDYAKEKKKDIVFICNDLKEDWWEMAESKQGKKTPKSPRKELIKEIKDNSGVNFWMYSQVQFLEKSNTILKSNISSNKIDQISAAITKQNLDEYLHFRCNICNKEDKIDVNKLELDFECVGGGERQMGIENQYEAERTFECRHCENIIHGIFEVWEYPIGMINYQQIKLEGATLMKECYIDLDLSDGENQDFVEEHYIITDKILELKKDIVFSLVLPKTININNTVFKVEPEIKSNEIKRFEFQAYNANGYSIKRTIILEKDANRFDLRPDEDENFWLEYNTLILTSPTDLKIKLSVIEYEEYN